MRTAPRVTLTETQRKQLKGYALGRRVAVRLALRAKIVLLAADGRQNKPIAAQLSVWRQLVARWRNRFFQAVGADKGIEIIRKTTLQKPPNATHWSPRTRAQQAGVSASTVGRIWRAPGRKPHGVHTFKLSKVPVPGTRDWPRC